MAGTIRDLLEKHRHRFKTQQEYADKLGVDVGHLNRLLNEKVKYATLNVENCLRFAALCDEDPTEVLAAAQKLDIAQLIESLYGKSDLNPAERRALKAWRGSARVGHEIALFALESLKKSQVQGRGKLESSGPDGQAST